MQTRRPSSLIEAIIRLLASRGITVLDNMVEVQELSSNGGQRLHNVVAQVHIRPTVAEILTKATGRPFKAIAQAWILDQQEAARIVQSVPEDDEYQVPKLLRPR